MRWIKAIISAISTFTRVPMPRPEWDGDAMKLAIAFFPLAGAIVGGIVWAWQIVCRYFQVSAVLFAAIAVVLPILVTGGIHMDGYCDTSDALASWRGKERGLEILKDPHVGAFALIRFGVYLLVNFALLHELFSQNLDTGIGVLYFLSRCFAAWSAITMPGARKSGVLASFTEQLDRRAAGIIAASFTALGAAGWIWLTFPAGLAGLTLCLLVTLWYRAMTAKRFGGVTGDTTGYYLQILELALLAGLLIGGILAKWQ